MVKKCGLFVIVVMLMIVSLSSHTVFADVSIVDTDTPVVLLGNYNEVLTSWEESSFNDNHLFSREILPSAFLSDIDHLTSDNYGYSHPVYEWSDDSSFSFHVNVDSEGCYQIAVDFYSLSDDYLDMELQITINGELQYTEASQIILYKQWAQNEEFSVDRYGNDFYGAQTQIKSWIRQDFFDPMGLFVEPLLFHLNQGDNVITLEKTKGEMLVGDILVSGKEELKTYDEYIGNNVVSSTEVLLTTEAEIPSIKNASSIQPGISRTVGITPFSVRYLKLNTLAGSTYNSERESVTYEVDVPRDGYYYLTFKVLQSDLTNGVVFRTLRVNGEVPFVEALSLGIQFDSLWQKYTVGNDNPYLFHLKAGINTISLSVDLSPYMNIYYVLNDVLDYVNSVSLQIKKLTGNQVDQYRDWNITEFMPNIVSDLNMYALKLETMQEYLGSLSTSSKLSEAEAFLKIAIRNLLFLADAPNDIPKNMSLLSTSSSSIASTLGNSISLLLDSPLDMDKFYVHTSVDLENPNANFFARAWVNIKRFVISFFDQRYSTTVSEDELVVWINRPKQYVDLIQKMIDDSFTKDTGIKVSTSVMAAEGKLILANSAGTNPDVALGVSSWLPYDLGIRGAIVDLSVFESDPDFSTVLNYFQEESLIPMVYNNGLYGLPDTENFYVLFYRTDIMSSLGIEIPSTWEDVTQIMPILKRYGMNFYIPLSSATSLKSFDSTLPFLFQYGSTVYQDNGFYVSLDNEPSVSALEMMTELYTIYSMDTTVTSFYNDFRLGLSPIGVGDFGMYITLLNAAPDIQGLWSIALLPGVKQDNGEIVRYAPGAQTANMIFNNTDKLDESWEFLKWWVSTDTQSTFSNLLLSTLGKEYLWNSANISAFQSLNMNASDLAIILEQWSFLKELPKVPGSYQVELEISNIWNSVVIDRENLMVLLNDGIIKMNKEIQKKMSEFGYMDKSGNILKPYVMPSVSIIQKWKSGESNG